MPSLSSVIPHLKIFLLGLLMVLLYALEANVAARLSVTMKETSIRTKMAKDGCRDRCGDVIIPYPFGMDTSNCYRDISYKITCAKSYRTRNPVASLNTSPDRYEVSKITLDYIQINMVAPLTCNTTNFYRVPFPVSNTLNKLTVFGCNVYGYIKPQTGPAETISRIDNNTSLNSKGRGCKSSCDRSTKIPAISCAGDGCCKTEIPKGLTSYSIQTTGIVPDSSSIFSKKKTTNSTGFTNPYAGTLNKTNSNGITSPCVLAVLINQEFLGVRDLLNLQIYLKYESFVPVILDWAIIDATTCKEAQRNSSSYACGRNSYCLESPNGPGYRCKCSKGYEGNPYLPRGCQDVDECKETRKCGKGVICINTQGSYYCRCPPDKTLETHELGNYCRPRKERFLADQKNKRRLRIFVIASSGIGVTIVIVLLLGIGYWLYRGFEKRKQRTLKQRHFEKNGGLLLKQKITSNDGRVEKAGRIFVIEELRNITDNFNPSRIIGKGGQGTVYKGMLPDGEIVAIKKSKLADETQVDQFINEVVILSQINHRNIVKLLGCCLETEVPLLVYEFVSNGTLSSHLHAAQEDGGSLLSWKVRVRIASEIAGALGYLHSDAHMPIFHRDIKSTNILLDEKYKAKVADFGLSRSIPVDKTHLTTVVQGTFGYLDPEYFHSSQFTDKSDVYSFGVVLVELLTGEKAVSILRKEEEKSLALYLVKSMKQNRLFEILDSRVLNEGDGDDVLVVAKLAKRCLKLNGKKRPTMKEVSHCLGELHEKLSTDSLYQ
ncbi:hypothetical protein C5167_000195 [Papaver somniferum]|uniref:Protein kinase domain-containing protein n=1 Tax=Papaver somniferum TaxID=3469 RepID=A0A4Y7KTL9_PAPSO|nr:wall-associated receptor kinase-like 1 [Papaver somniferum]RZC75752.1 hypothetical protein C5167_000195 [Papaver somniferum]